jgi:hypothetical protein
MPYLVVRKTDGERTVIPYSTPGAARAGLDGMRKSLALNGWTGVAEEPERSFVARAGDVLATVQVRHGFPPEGPYTNVIQPPAAPAAKPFRPARWLVAAAVAGILSIGAMGGAGAQWLEQAFAADKEHEFTGYVEAMPADGHLGDWRVAGRTVRVTEFTQIDQKDALVALGSRVEVEGVVLLDGTISATEIEGEN